LGRGVPDPESQHLFNESGMTDPSPGAGAPPSSMVVLWPRARSRPPKLRQGAESRPPALPKDLEPALGAVPRASSRPGVAGAGSEVPWGAGEGSTDWWNVRRNHAS
jgi:hypothetical protein